ncbi:MULTISPECIES: hypothetical protein [unclassified Nonomuraea]|uniref:hypothetical protein n=1 Tax=unclassified Nonomuraea TaxID=2593643 RepID=UPI00191C59A2|nr:MULTISPECIES: hypothetical protein [unclassified Nonomuraea]
MTDALTLPATPSATPPPAASTSYRWRWPALAVILTGSVMEMLDSTVTSIAGPTIRADLGGGASLIQWLGVAYTLVSAGASDEFCLTGPGSNEEISNEVASDLD